MIGFSRDIAGYLPLKVLWIRLTGLWGRHGQTRDLSSDSHAPKHGAENRTMLRVDYGVGWPRLVLYCSSKPLLPHKYHVFRRDGDS